MGRIESLYCYLKEENLGCYNWSITRLEMAFFILLKVESAKEMAFLIHMITLGDNMKNLRWIKKILFLYNLLNIVHLFLIKFKNK